MARELTKASKRDVYKFGNGGRSAVVDFRIIRDITTYCDVPRAEAALILKAIVTTMVEALKRGETIRIRDLGTFRPAIQKPYYCYNYMTQQNYWTKEKKTVRFKAVSAIRHALDLPYDAPEEIPYAN